MKPVKYLPCTKDEWTEAYQRSSKERKPSYHFTQMLPTGSLAIQKI
jgi:hypothetical protein